LNQVKLQKSRETEREKQKFGNCDCYTLCIAQTDRFTKHFFSRYFCCGKNIEVISVPRDKLKHIKWMAGVLAWG